MTSIELCLKYELSKDEYFAIELLNRRNVFACMEYIGIYGEPSTEILESLLKKGLVITRNPEHPSYDDTIVNRNVFEEQEEAKLEMAEELWQKYPAAFPLGDGGMFIARKGPDKIAVLKLYLERINNSPDKHKFVMTQLGGYIKLVMNRKINGHRIHDWISNEMWDIIPGLTEVASAGFKKDI